MAKRRSVKRGSVKRRSTKRIRMTKRARVARKAGMTRRRSRLSRRSRRGGEEECIHDDDIFHTCNGNKEVHKFGKIVDIPYTNNFSRTCKDCGYVKITEHY